MNRIYFLFGSVVLALHLASEPAFSYFYRRGWLYDLHSNVPGIQNSTNLRLHRIAVAAAYHTNQIVSETRILGSGTIDLGSVQLELRGSRRVSQSLGLLGRQNRGAFEDNPMTFSLGLSRTYLSPSGLFGRFTVEYLRFFPIPPSWVHFGIQGGKIGMGSDPWSMDFSINFFLSLKSEGAYLSFVLGGYRNVYSISEKSALAAGISLGFGNTLKSASEANTLNEHIEFSIEPNVKYTWDDGYAKFGVPLRMWLDREITNHGVHYPNDLSFPGFAVSLGYLL